MTFLECDIRNSNEFEKVAYTEGRLKNLFIKYASCSRKEMSKIGIIKKPTKKGLYIYEGVGSNFNSLTADYRDTTISFLADSNIVLSAGMAYNFPFILAPNKFGVIF